MFKPASQSLLCFLDRFDLGSDFVFDLRGGEGSESLPLPEEDDPLPDPLPLPEPLPVLQKNKKMCHDRRTVSNDRILNKRNSQSPSIRTRSFLRKPI